jgi:hypothetical protein
MADVSKYPSALMLRVEQFKNTWDCQTLKDYNICGCIAEWRSCLDRKLLRRAVAVTCMTLLSSLLSKRESAGGRSA